MAAPPILIGLIGLPGSGKSTLARKLLNWYRVWPTRHIQSDRVRKALFPTPSYTPEERHAVYATMERRASDALLEGSWVIYDATNIRANDRATMARIAGDNGAALALLHIVTDEAIVIGRLQRRAQTSSSLSDADERVYQMMVQQFEPLTRPHLVVANENTFDPMRLQIDDFIQSQLNSA